MALEEKNTEEGVIKSPVVGTFYEGPILQNPAEKSYVKVGDHVNPETIVCELEAMMVALPVKAKMSGTIKERLVNTGDAVDYNQPLYKVTPDNSSN